MEIDHFLRQKPWLDAPPHMSGVASRAAQSWVTPHVRGGASNHGSRRKNVNSTIEFLR